LELGVHEGAGEEVPKELGDLVGGLRQGRLWAEEFGKQSPTLLPFDAAVVRLQGELSAQAGGEKSLADWVRLQRRDAFLVEFRMRIDRAGRGGVGGLEVRAASRRKEMVDSVDLIGTEAADGGRRFSEQEVRHGLAQMVPPDRQFVSKDVLFKGIGGPLQDSVDAIRRCRGGVGAQAGVEGAKASAGELLTPEILLGLGFFGGGRSRCAEVDQGELEEVGKVVH